MKDLSNILFFLVQAEEKYIEGTIEDEDEDECSDDPNLQVRHFLF